MKHSYISHTEDYIKTPAYSTSQLPYEKSSIYTPIYYKLNSLNSSLNLKSKVPSIISMIGHDRLLDSLSNFQYK